MTYIPNTPFGHVLRQARDEHQDAADGWQDGRAGKQPVQPQNEHYMRAWREGRRDAETARAI